MNRKRSFFSYLRPYLPFAILSPLLMMGEVLADLMLPTLMSNIVDYGISGAAPGQKGAFSDGIHRMVLGLLESIAPGYGQMHVIITYGIIMLVTVLIGGFFGTFCAYTAATAAQGFGKDLRCDTYRRVMSLSIEQTDRFTTGSLVTRLTNDVTMVMDFVESLIRMFVRSPVFFVGGTVALILLYPPFGFVLLAGLPLMALVLFLVLRRAIPMFSQVQVKLDRVNSVVQENVSGARVVKAYVQEEYENRRFEKANADLKDTNYKVLRLMCIMHPVLTVVMNAAIIAVIAIGGIRIELGDTGMSTGSIMAAITYVSQVLMSIMMMTMMFQMVSRAAASARRIREVLDCDPVIESGNETQAPGGEAVTFANVSFRYPGTTGNPVLQNVNFSIHKGEFFAIIGATGSGKTSLVNLIPRFYDPTEGTVLVDGLPLGRYRLSTLRKKIGFVMQKSELFSETVENNIKWGKPQASKEEVKAAAEVAQAKEFIEGLPQEYETFIAEKGASLSGGQKQRLSISRAVVRKPDILIFDDATSALDLVTETRLQNAVRSTMGDTTFIMIAQRIASVKGADRIAVLEEDGTVSHIGTHEELLEKSETYREIVASQNRNGGASHE